MPFNPFTGELQKDKVGTGGGGGGTGIVQTIVAGTNVTVDSTDPANPIVSSTGGGGGSSSLSPSYHLKEQASATTVYSGINSVSSSTADTNWSVNKLVVTTDPERSRQVYTATGAWTNRASLTYTTSITYNL